LRDKINDFSQIEGSDPNATDNELVEVLDEQYDVLKGANALAVVTEWNQFRNPDFLKIKEELSAPIVFDGRNLYSPELLAEKGFAYFCIGRK
jgi:UDPglucose 6-dehydrogenase